MTVNLAVWLWPQRCVLATHTHEHTLARTRAKMNKNENGVRPLACVPSVPPLLIRMDRYTVARTCTELVTIPLLFSYNDKVKKAQKRNII